MDTNPTKTWGELVCSVYVTMDTNPPKTWGELVCSVYVTQPNMFHVRLCLLYTCYQTRNWLYLILYNNTALQPINNSKDVYIIVFKKPFTWRLGLSDFNDYMFAYI